MTRAFVFPGQGSQYPGMGRELAAAFPVVRHSFEEVDDALGFALSRVMFDGPETELTLTENAQPALLSLSAAVMRLLGESGLELSRHVLCVAGHSLGEYSALVAAGSMSLVDAVRLVRLRGKAMQTAVPVGLGAMVALIGADLPLATRIADAAREGDILAAANDNAPGQVVLSGHAVAVDRVPEVAQQHGVKRAIRLPVSAPFHSPLMAPAAAAMREALSSVSLRRPVVALYANVTAGPVFDPEDIRRLLVDQVTSLVRWRESVLAMRMAGATQLVEIGAGKVLSGLASRIDNELMAISVGTPAGVEALIASL